MKRRFLAVFLALALCVGLAPPAFAAAEEFVIDENGALTEYNGPGGDVVIPSSVTSIGDSAFDGCTSLTGVTIPSSVTSIGDYAFCDCESLTSVTIPGSVTSIGVGAFAECTSLTSLTIPSSVTSIGYAAFYGCTSLIGVTIPDSVTSIDGAAFYDCTSLTSVTIPSSVTSIGGGAFANCANINISVDSGNPNYTVVDGVLFSKDMTLLHTYPGGKQDSSYSIPSGVTSIGEDAFAFCESLTGVTIPSSVTSIGDYAFNGCRSLTGVTIPSSVTKIGDYAFVSCESLTSVTIPSSVTSIGGGAFANCANINISVDSGNPNYTAVDGVLFSKDMTLLHTYPGGKQDSSYSIPSGVTSIGDHAFELCQNLTGVAIPTSVTSIGDYAFDGCTSLTGVAIPSSVTKIGDYAFNSCGSLTSVTIPNSVTSIGFKAFEYCTSLTSVTIPASVTSIEWWAFDGCMNLTDVYYGGSEEQWNAVSIEGENDSLTSATIHYNSTIPEPPVSNPDTVGGFGDVKSGAYYAGAVGWAVANGITAGTSATTFSPDQTCTHTQILTFLWRAAGEPASSAALPVDITGKNIAYAETTLRWAAEKGMIGKSFDPMADCTRADAVNYIWQAKGKASAGYDGRFADVPASSPYATAVAWALENGVTAGTGDTTFSPDNICNRGQIVTFLHRYFGK